MVIKYGMYKKRIKVKRKKLWYKRNQVYRLEICKEEKTDI